MRAGNRRYTYLRYSLGIGESFRMTNRTCKFSSRPHRRRNVRIMCIDEARPGRDERTRFAVHAVASCLCRASDGVFRCTMSS